MLFVTVVCNENLLVLKAAEGGQTLLDRLGFRKKS